MVSAVRKLEDLPLRERRDLLRAKGELSTAEAALYLDLKRKTLYNLLAMEQGPRHIAKCQSKTGRGGRLKFLVSDLDAYDQQRSEKKDAYSK